MLGREPQVDRQRCQVAGDAGDRRRVAGLPLGGERGGPPLRHGDRLVAGFGLTDVEDRPEVGLDLGLVVGRYLGEHVPGAVPRHRWRKLLGEDVSVTVRVRNTGRRRGKEVVQVFLSRPPPNRANRSPGSWV